jgi:hypothetical protein
MYLNVTELNELIYSLGIAEMKGSFVNKGVNSRLRNKLSTELEKRNIELAEQCEKDKIEHDMNFKNAYYRKGDY